ncbi:hypothetical protein [Endozoicomonas numazuensis]|nr:hypothetical protein [Endozoicomonas numazuensis]
MREKLLKDILIQKGKLDCYFGDEVPVSLWRALKKKIEQWHF